MQRKAVGRLPHALLCCGPSGLGKQVFAERLAQALLCHSPGPDGSPCGLCRSCHLFLGGSHPDYIQVKPAEAGKPIKVDQVRELAVFMGYTSSGSSYKIALLNPAERMNVNAANSLLKTLEEPPAGSLLLLVTATPARLPATVRSRCQKLVLQAPTPREAMAWLASVGVGSTDPALLLSLSGGAPLLARAYAETDCLARRRELLSSYTEVMTGKADPVTAAELWVKGNMTENLCWLIGWHMDMIRLKMAAAPPRLYNPDVQAVLQRLSWSLSPQTLFRRLDAAIRMRELYTTQVNPQLMLESFLADCASE